MFLAAALRSRYVPVTFLAFPLRTAGITCRLLGFTFLLRSSDLGLPPMLWWYGVKLTFQAGLLLRICACRQAVPWVELLRVDIPGTALVLLETDSFKTCSCK